MTGGGLPTACVYVAPVPAELFAAGTFAAFGAVLPEASARLLPLIVSVTVAPGGTNAGRYRATEEAPAVVRSGLTLAPFTAAVMPDGWAGDSGPVPMPPIGTTRVRPSMSR